MARALKSAGRGSVANLVGGQILAWHWTQSSGEARELLEGGHVWLAELFISDHVGDLDSSLLDKPTTFDPGE